MADLSLQDYGTIQVPNMLDIMTKQATLDKYNLDVAKESRNFNALRQYGEAAARGDDEAQKMLQSKFPEAAKTFAEIGQTQAATTQQLQTTQREFVSGLAQELSQIKDPTQRMAYAMDRLSTGVDSKSIHPDMANYYRKMLVQNPGALDAMLYQGLKPSETPEIFGKKQRIEKSMEPPVQIPVEGAGPGGFVQRQVPRQNLPGAWGAPGPGGGEPSMFPSTVPGGAKGSTGGPLLPPGNAAPGVNGPGPSNNYAPGAVRTEELPPLPPSRGTSGTGPRSDAGGTVEPASASSPAADTSRQIQSVALAERMGAVPQGSATAVASAAADRILAEPEAQAAPAAAPTARPSATPGAIPSGPVGQRIKAETAKYSNLNDELTQSVADLESKHGTEPDRPGSQYRGVFQLGNGERTRWGGSGIPQGVQSLSARKDELTQRLGREPENWEVYMAHQQGALGASRLIQNPDTPAGQLTNPRYIASNKGDPNAPASEFTDQWKQKYETTAASYRGAAPPQAASDTLTGQEQARAPAVTPATAPAATARPSAAAQAPGAGFGLFVGDSITAQQIRHGGTGTEDAPNSGQPIQAGLTAGIGDGPKRILDRINTLDSAPETVFLSSGATNRPTEVGAVDDQITQLGKKGAKYVVVPGVGPGVANADMVNAILKDTVEKPRDGVQGVYFDPQVKWISNKNEQGIHPAQVDKVREQALKALENARASATLTNEQRQSSAENPTPEEATGPTGPPDVVLSEGRGAMPAAQLVADRPPDELVSTPRAGQSFGATPPAEATTPSAGLGGAAPLGTRPYVDIPGSYAAPHPLIMKDIEKNQDETRAEFAEVTKQYKGANAGMVSLGQLEAILDKGYVTGMSAGVREEVSNILSTTANIFGKTSSITDRQAAMYNMFTSISKTLGFDMVSALGSREAQQIVAQVMDIKPSAFHTVAGNRAIIATLREAFNMTIDKKQFYEKWIADQGNYGRLGVDEAFQKSHPWQTYASKAMPLQIPREDGKIQYDKMIPNANYDISHFKNRETGDTATFDGEGLKYIGKPKHLRETGIR